MFFCASLPDSTARRIAFERNFFSRDSFKIIDAVDGRSWTEEDADRFCAHELTQLRASLRRQGKKWASPAAIACALTHRDLLLRRAEAIDAILCEDDATFHPDFIEAWSRQSNRQVLREIEGVTLLYHLSRGPVVVEKAPVAKIGPFKAYRVKSNNVLSAVAYYASPDAAAGIRRVQTPLVTSSDNWHQFKQLGAFKDLYIMHPAPVTLAPFDSVIGYGGLIKGDSLLARTLRRMNRILRKHLRRSGPPIIFE